MERRELLALAGLAGLSGCLGYDVVETETRTQRRVRIAELEARVERRDEQLAEREATIADLEAQLQELRRQFRGPRINLVSLVDDWERLGDVVHRSADRVAAGEPAEVAFNYTYPVHPRGTTGRAEVLERVELTNLDGETVTSAERRVELFIDPDQTLAESALELDTESLPPGQYSAVAFVTDLVTNIEAEPAATVVSIS
jgi:uncharacterized coiled-coil protein SlyX